MKKANSSVLDAAQSFLMMPDLFHWLLTGEKGNELTNATTSQLFNPVTKQWSQKLIEGFGLPGHIFGEIVDPGSVVGPLRESVLDQIGLKGTKVVRPGTHDTASAVVAVPAKSSPGEMPNWCYISSGTWSLMGVETPHPIINEQCAALNYTNEGGVYGTTRLLKNIAGLWLVQECRRIWKQNGHEYGYSDLVRMSQEATPLASFVNPDHGDFAAPQDMPAQIREFCQRTSQVVPQSDGAVIRCVLESLAMRYRVVHRNLQDLTGAKIDTIHIVGGGTQNQLLCQMAADACNCQVVAGPVEATAIGNLMLQAVAAGDIGSLAEGREVIRNSFPVVTYEPKTPTMWDDAFPRFEKMCKKLPLRINWERNTKNEILSKRNIMIKVGIVGVGFMSWIHYLAYQKVRGMKVTSFCSRDPKKQKGDWRGIKGNFGPPGEKIDVSKMTVYATLDELLADDSIDMVDICLPPALHEEATIAALKAGKHVLVEKPIALDPAAAKRMQKAAE
ncbi:rhaB, partial [Symbiodinium microadriaticum]